MASPGDGLLAALGAVNYQPQDNAPGIAASLIGSNAQNLVNPYNGSGSIAGTVGSGLLAAVLAGVAHNQAVNQNLQMQPVINQYLGANPDDQAKILQANPRLLPLQTALLSSKFDIQQEAAKEAAVKRADIDPALVLKNATNALDQLGAQGGHLDANNTPTNIVGAGTSNPVEIDPILQKAKEAQATTTGNIGAQLAMYGGTGGISPNDALSKAQEEIGKLETDPATQKYIGAKISAQAAAANAVEAMKSNDGVADIGLILNSIKAIDPNAKVSQGKYDVDAAPGSLQQELKDYYAFVSDGGKLTNQHRQQIIQEVLNQIKPMQTEYEQRVSRSVPILQSVNKLNLLRTEPAFDYDGIRRQVGIPVPIDPAVKAQYQQLRASGMSAQDAGAKLGIQ